MVLLFAALSGCSDDTGPLDGSGPDSGTLVCDEAQSQALALYQAVFPEIGEAACLGDDDCVLLDADVECEAFSNYQTPIAVHTSEVERARGLLDERAALCGRTEAGCFGEPLAGCNNGASPRASCSNARCVYEPGCF